MDWLHADPDPQNLMIADPDKITKLIYDHLLKVQKEMNLILNLYLSLLGSNSKIIIPYEKKTFVG